MHKNIHPTQNSMSSSHPFTVVDDEDDTDICPVCDGQCTCRVEQYQPTPPPPPPLKIKFTLPPSLIAKRRLPSNKSSTNNQETTSASVTDAYTTPLKKRGRPPKHSLPPSTQYKHPSPVKSKKTATKVKQKLPTFVAASALSSISSASDSSSSTSSLSDFDLDTDSDIQAEEEKFIVADVHDKARLRRELLGGDDPHLKKRSPDWVIRPRKKSVAGSDAEQMDVDTDLTDDEAESQNDDDDDDDGEDEDEDEPDGMNGVEDEDEDTDSRHHYVGLATGWSEEDESSFDADLFFANLSDSSSNSSSNSTPTRRRCHSYTPGDIDTDQSSSTSQSHTTRTVLESLPFEVTENWDGQLVFTNGEADSRGIVDIDFEKDAERFLIDSDADDDDQSCSSSISNFPRYRPNYDPSSTAQIPESSDIDMFSISDADAGYEEEDGGEADEGDTTDEELVGDDSLPNERAMRLFTLPMGMGMSVSAINPMSTVSPTIGVEKRRHRRHGVDGDQEERKRWRRRVRLGVGAAAVGPRAADILAGKIVFLGDESANGYASSSDSMVNADKGKGKQKTSFSSSSSPSSHAKYSHQTQIPNTPRTGVFIPSGETRQVVIGDDRKGADVPSPHPRFYGRSRRVSVVQYLLEKHLQQQPSVKSPPATTTNGSSPSIISEAPSPFHHLLSPSAASPLTGTEDLTISTAPNINTSSGDDYDPGTPCPCPAEAELDDDAATCIVELDDVLEASFLDDSMDRECEAGGSSSLTLTSGTNSGLVEDSSTAPTAATAIFSTDSTAAAAASNKHLTRWDVISIGAFRQTREQQQQAWGPGSGSSTVADYGRVIKNGANAGSPLSALLWQNSGAGNAMGASAGSSKKSSSSSKPTSTSTPSASGARSKGSSTKAAKRRRLMASSTMSSPLVLPLSSTSLSTLPSKTHSSPLSSHSHSHSQRTPTTHKNRKELRRERKLLKRTSSSQSSSNHTQQQPSFLSTHPHAAHANNVSNHNNNNYHHQFHTHQHHPNLKTRGTSSSQRTGFFGGAVPPLNL